jgi:hypothetical protein
LSGKKQNLIFSVTPFHILIFDLSFCILVFDFWIY